jgi:hypothetical protein
MRRLCALPEGSALPDTPSPPLINDELLGPLVDGLFIPMTENGGSIDDVMALLECVNASVLAVAVQPGNDETALATFAANVGHRLVLLRRDHAAAAGSRQSM